MQQLPPQLELPEGDRFTLPTVSAVRTELTGAVMGSDDWQERASQSSANALKDAIAKSEAANVGFETLSRAGQPAEAIAQVARDKGIEHIVMGTRGLGRIQGLLMGSVAMKVIHLAQVPITLIK